MVSVLVLLEADDAYFKYSNILGPAIFYLLMFGKRVHSLFRCFFRRDYREGSV